MTNSLDNAETTFFSPDANRPLTYFRARSDYSPSPLRTLTRPDGQRVLAKDETDRMGLGSFKALGGPYAIARLIETRWKETHGETLRPERFLESEVRNFAAQMTFVCASAGNHGLGLPLGLHMWGQTHGST